MKYTLFAPLLLSSTAFAGAIRVKRQDPSPTTAAPSATASSSFIICRDARDCPTGERCMFVTHNGLNNGYNGACVTEDYTYVPPPQPSPFGPCQTYLDCREDEFCQYETITADGKGEDGHCGSSIADIACTRTTMCRFDQYCDNGKCTNFQDCRTDSCTAPPVGEVAYCSPQQANITDTRNPDNVFVCVYPSSNSTSSASSVSSASSTAASSSDSISSVVSSAASASVTGTVSSASSAAPTTAPVVSTTPAPVFEASSAVPAPAPAHSSDAAPAPAPAPQPSQEAVKPAPANDDNKDDSAWRDEYRDQQNAEKFKKQ